MMNGKAKQAIASVLTLGLLAGCAGSSVGDSVQQSLEADPQLEESPPFAADDSEASSDNAAELAEPNAAAPTTDADSSDSGNSQFIGPVRPKPTTSSVGAAESEEETSENASLENVPADLRPYIRDLQALADITLVTAGKEQPSDSDSSPFTQTISRREYARWLFESYNAIYADEPGDRLRAGTASDEPAFQDVPPSDPDFAEIQGLADAGIIPSAFTGNSTDVNFRPDAPLTRADLILWKVPLDIRAALPSTTPEAVTTAWGFQDSASIDALALRAIAADFQLGDFANFRRAFGYTTLFRPDKAVTRAEAAAVLWRFGTQTEGITAAEAQSS